MRKNLIIDIIIEFIKKQLLISSIFNVGFFLLILFFLNGCSGECETAEEIMSDPQTISIYANPKDGNKNLSGMIKPQDTWISTGHAVDGNQAQDPYFNIINNDGDLCGKNSSNNVQLTAYGAYKQVGAKVNNGDTIKIQLNKKEFTVNCSSPGSDVGVTDLDKCKNRYYKKDGSSTDPIEPMDGKKVMLESFISIKSTSDISNDIEVNKHIYNAFIPRAMLNGITTNITNGGMLNFEATNTIIPSKAFIVPSAYEIEITGGAPSTEKHYFYGSLPDINSIDQKFLEYQFTSVNDFADPNRANVVNKNYWCRAYTDKYINMPTAGYIPDGTTGTPITGILNRSIDIDGLMINKFCDKYYYLDKGDENDLTGVLEEDTWKQTTLANKPKGNTGSPEKIYSIMENLSYQNIEAIDLSDPALAVKKNQPIFLNHSRFFYTLNLAIASSSNSSTVPIGPGNINTSYSNCNTKSYLTRCDSRGDIQLPLDQEILIHQDGFVHVKIGNSLNVNIVGNANLKITRSCPIKKLYGIFIENSDDLKKNNVKPGDGGSFEIPLYQDDADGVPERLEKFTIPRSMVSGSKKWLYLSFKDNGDGYDNNTGLIQLATRIPRDYSKAVTGFINSVINRLMEVLYGKKIHPSDINSPRIGGAVNSIYNNLINSSKFQNIIRLCAILLIVIYGLFILMGLAQFNSGDLLRTIIKFGTIFILLQPGSWEFFKTNFFNLFIEGPKQFISIVTTPPNETMGQNTNDYIFGPISNVIERFTDFAIWKQIVSILLAGPLGWIIFLFLLQSCWFFITGSLMAILSYIVSTVILGLFISVAPIFILMLMFKRTAGIFNAWVKVLMVYTLNAVFVFASLTLVSQIVSILINQIFGFGVCTSCIFEYHADGALANFQFCILYGDRPDNLGTDHLSYDERKMLEQATSSYASSGMQFAGFPFPFFAFISFVIMSHLVSNLSAFFGLMTEDLLGVDFGNPTQAANIPDKVADTMKSFVGLDAQGKQQEVERRRKKSGTREIKVVDKDQPEKKEK